MTDTKKPPKQITELQRHVLDYLHVFLALNDCLPPAAHIAREFGWSSANSARLHLVALEKKGLLKRNELGGLMLVRGAR
jgi:SOS-response transcriptional repressor LexA